jgi:DNA (cytosine-5)-methyltransferase 1
MALTSVEVCAGAGGQALGLEQAGFKHSALVEVEEKFCETLTLNRKKWNVICDDIKNFDGRPYAGADLFAGGLPCPPFSKAGKQLGQEDERNLFPDAIRLIDEIRPKAILIENVRGFLDAVFEDYRNGLKRQLEKLGYKADWRLLNASDFGVPQLRPRVVIYALRKELWDNLEMSHFESQEAPTVGEALYEMMKERGWRGAREWSKRANEIAPTVVGGSKKHGGPDLGPTRAKASWRALGVDGMGIVDEAPERNFVGMPRLTVKMVAKLQGFPEDWQFSGRKTIAYRQVGNAFPPPVACAVARRIKKALTTRKLFSVSA